MGACFSRGNNRKDETPKRRRSSRRRSSSNRRRSSSHIGSYQAMGSLAEETMSESGTREKEVVFDESAVVKRKKKGGTVMATVGEEREAENGGQEHEQQKQEYEPKQEQRRDRDKVPSEQNPRSVVVAPVTPITANANDTNKHHRRKSHNLNETTSTANSSSNNDNVDTPTSSNSNNRHKKKNRRALLRVGSRILQSETITLEDGSSHEQLVRSRATTYDHVHDVVLTTFNGSDVARRCAGRVGLGNMGNTCFMNSSLQCLSNTIPLTDYFLGYDYKKEINKENFLGTKGELVVAYATLMKRMWLSEQRSLQPNLFKRKLEKFAPHFEGSSQHDAQELLAYLLDGIHEDLNRVKKRPYIEDKDCDGRNDHGDAMMAWQNYLLRNKSIVVDLFQGQLRNVMICRNASRTQPDGSKGCGHKNVKFEPFMYLSLPISDSSNTLDDCLALYCTEEHLTGDDRWYCPKCKDHVDATKKFDLWMLPPILIVHLKRFKYTDLGKRSKITRAVEYPLEAWDLKEFVRSTKKGASLPLYDLYAVSNHVGGLGSGHYTAYGRNRFDDEWYEFNDSRCTRIDSSQLGHSPSAYCLFYNRTERSRKGTDRKMPVVRRQSVDRPELWPHMQMTKDYRGFQRSTKKLKIDFDDDKSFKPPSPSHHHPTENNAHASLNAPVLRPGRPEQSENAVSHHISDSPHETGGAEPSMQPPHPLPLTLSETMLEPAPPSETSTTTSLEPNPAPQELPSTSTVLSSSVPTPVGSMVPIPVPPPARPLKPALVLSPPPEQVRRDDLPAPAQPDFLPGLTAD